jgi:putative RNA 2'-phosphotransferase
MKWFDLGTQMSSTNQKQISKSLSYVLRHRPDSIGINLDGNGWIAVDTLLSAFQAHGQDIPRDVLERVVAESDKQRFEFNDDKSRIRARQGHSVEVDLGYESAIPPPTLYHGTAVKNLESIFKRGLLKGNRHHVHMSTNQETMSRVGMRHGKPVLLSIKAEKMYIDGHQFFLTGNNVWLTDHVPPQYISRTDD